MEQPQRNLEEELGRQWRPALLTYFRRRLRNPDEAEDMVQEVLVRMLRRDDVELQVPEAYVFQIASNLLADRARRLKVRTDYQTAMRHDYLADVDTLDPHRVVEGRLELQAAMARIRQLPDRTRTIFILYRFENFNQNDIAAGLGISASAVKKHVAKAVAQLMQPIEIVK